MVIERGSHRRFKVQPRKVGLNATAWRRALTTELRRRAIRIRIRTILRNDIVTDGERWQITQHTTWMRDARSRVVIHYGVELEHASGRRAIEINAANCTARFPVPINKIIY